MRCRACGQIAFSYEVSKCVQESVSHRDLERSQPLAQNEQRVMLHELAHYLPHHLHVVRMKLQRFAFCSACRPCETISTMEMQAC